MQTSGTIKHFPSDILYGLVDDALSSAHRARLTLHINGEVTVWQKQNTPNLIHTRPQKNKDTLLLKLRSRINKIIIYIYQFKK